ncbi:hypothetical protein A0J61_08033 [Choanephora cucurbitarum]|uniref:Uncharacterized protein n=1 Tax=Choanephora cucurbitarum TaxID=101091 RepID=A0A1C7N4G0_9FUNG|nr:hypothetical protein A0J61_08033 [Choanephora cucurbitarum]
MLQKKNHQAIVPGAYPNEVTQKHRYINLVHRIKHWRQKEPLQKQENNQINVSFTVNNHYHYQQSEHHKPSIVQQIVVLPPAQVYGLMALVALFLIIVGFALVQVHRTISILQVVLESLEYIVLTSMSGLGSIVSWIKRGIFY